MSRLLPSFLIALTLGATAQAAGAHDLAINQTAVDSINREAQRFTGHACEGHYRVVDMFADARPAHLKFAHETLLRVTRQRLGGRADQLLKSDLIPGQMSRIYADLSSMKTPSGFMMAALQPYQGKNHIIAYQCQLK